MSYFNIKNMKSMPTLFVLSFFLMTYQANTGFAGKKEIEIPKLQNPISVQYIKENLRKSKPRMVFNKKKVTFDLTPSLGNLVKNATRTFMKEGGTALRIEDKIEMNEKTKKVTWQLMTQAEVEIVAEGAILKQGGRELKLINLSHPSIPLGVVSLNPPPHKLDKLMENLKRVELRIPAPVSSGTAGGMKISMRLERN